MTFRHDLLQELRSAFIDRRLTMQKREGDWWLATRDGGAGVAICTFWRLRDPSHILVSVEDDGHCLGHSEPVHVEAKLNESIADLQVQDLTVDSATGDLRFLFSSGASLEIIVTSSGYECWEAYRTEKQHLNLLAIGRSGGIGFSL